jgi:hypothetical protein
MIQILHAFFPHHVINSIGSGSHIRYPGTCSMGSGCLPWTSTWHGIMAQEMEDDIYAYDSENDSEHSSLSKQAETPERETEGVKIDIIQVGEIVQYTIPSFPVLTINLRHCVTSMWDNTDEKVKMFDAFFARRSRHCYECPIKCGSHRELQYQCKSPSILNIACSMHVILPPLAISCNKDVYTPVELYFEVCRACL